MASNHDAPQGAGKPGALVPAAEQGTAIQQAEQQLRSQYELDRLTRMYALQIANQQWGKKLSKAEQYTVARYALELDLDPGRHIVILGGRPYITADAYIDRAAARDDIEEVSFTNITADAEKRRAWGVPEFAKAAWLCTVKKRGMQAVVECGYAPKSQKDGGDPVGQQFPHEKARATAARRALRLVIPIWTQRAEELERELEHLHAQARESLARSGGPLRYRAVEIPDDPYAVEEPPPREELPPATERAEPAPAGDLFGAPSALSEGR